MAANGKLFPCTGKNGPTCLLVPRDWALEQCISEQRSCQKTTREVVQPTAIKTRALFCSEVNMFRTREAAE